MTFMAARLGELFSILSVLAFGFGGVAIAKARKSGPGDGGAILSVGLTALLSAALWVSTAQESQNLVGRPGALVGLAWFALSGLLATALARSLYFLSVRDLGAIRGAAIKRAIPFFSVLFGVVFLGEILTSAKLGGLLLIAISVAALVAVDLAGSGKSSAPAAEQIEPMGYIWGTASGLCYASAYVARKLGLDLVPDGALGTFVGAMAAMGYYVLTALVSGRSRKAILSALMARNIWGVAAALCFAAGQIANFYAIQYTAISTVGAIQSLEVFVSMLIASLLLRTERAPNLLTIAAAVVATAGVLLVVA
ncbi:MAG: DMT family transporter [Bosea sp.]|jgi:drug/metabolite transporter (DMT)-like permease|uniref:DMT family transporter n=1 Tax=Hyphomicrobiales TaxID=356 RepID=UPI0009EAF6FD|nr:MULTISPECIES: DMT family transporter [Hyphomicrobiales]MCP4561822.1 DMT family transporter [Bosea sp. (in: a-proteobacteria)]MCP4738217.1 DMT family transporter [Bosea sp. (in: a-proteobacteria)]MDX3804827.1 DMT family transporter [Bosea sp. (in: a-proteobacteria)]